MILTRANLSFDTATGELSAACAAHATPTEGRVLEALMLRNGVVGRVLLMDRVDNGRPDGPDEATLDVYICRLRRKLRDIGALVKIACIWGRGYVLEPPAPVAAFVRVPAELLRQCAALARRYDPALAGRLEQVES